jgi:hypothetical protein
MPASASPGARPDAVADPPASPLVRDRLYDIDVVVSRTIAYGALTVPFAGVPPCPRPRRGHCRPTLQQGPLRGVDYPPATAVASFEKTAGESGGASTVQPRSELLRYRLDRGAPRLDESSVVIQTRLEVDL